MNAICFILAVFISSLNVKELSAVKFTSGCPTFGDVGAIYIDIKKYEGLWYDFLHSKDDYTCSLDKFSTFQNSTGYYLKGDFPYRAPNGSALEELSVSKLESAEKQQGYAGYEDGHKYMNAFLDIDYDKYSIEFGCEEDDEGPSYDLYAITRSKEMDNSVLEKVEEFNKKLELGLKINNHLDQCEGLK